MQTKEKELNEDFDCITKKLEKLNAANTNLHSFLVGLRDDLCYLARKLKDIAKEEKIKNGK